MEQEHKSYYAIIPANVRYSDITPNAKLLYGEITALCNEKGYCWATNEYFAKLYKVSKVSVSLWIKQLSEKGFINTEIKDNYARKIFLGGLKENLKGGLRKLKGGLKENLKGSSTQIAPKHHTSKGFIGSDNAPNNTMNNTDNSAADAAKKDLPFNSDQYVKEMTGSNQRHIQIIGWYITAKGLIFPSLKAAQAEIKRHLRDAAVLADYTDEQTARAVQYVKNKFREDWKLSTVLKYINQF